MAEQKTIIAVKAFDKDFKCKGFQYKVGETYEHDGDIKICSSGFHACENPMDVWNYYDIADSRYALVELSGDINSKDGDTKRCAAKITITAELSLPDFIGRAVDWLIGVATEDNDAASGYSSQLAASGYSSQLAASGNSSQLAASGYSSQLAASGDHSQLAASGYSSRLAASGYYSRLAASGSHSKLAASGDHSQLAASGDSSKLAASGDHSQLAASGYSSVIASSGPNSIAKGADGTWISIAEYDVHSKCIGFATGCIGKNGIKAGIYYKAKNGELVAA